jgi:phosphatidylglycerol:prolipoprotein diacylglycerol transferase
MIHFNFYGLIYSIGFLVFYYYLEKSKLKFKTLYFFLNVVFIIIFARIYHVISDFYLYKENITSILYIWNGGLAFFGGVFGFILANLIYLVIIKTKNYNIKEEIKHLYDLLNNIALFLPLLIFFGRIANYFNHENNGVFIIPQQFFEALLQGLIPFILLLFIKEDRFLWFVIFYSVARFITEFWRFYFGFKIVHIFCAILFLTSLSLLVYKKLKKGTNKIKVN